MNLQLEIARHLEFAVTRRIVLIVQNSLCRRTFFGAGVLFDLDAAKNAPLAHVI